MFNSKLSSSFGRRQRRHDARKHHFKKNHKVVTTESSAAPGFENSSEDFLVSPTVIENSKFHFERNPSRPTETEKPRPPKVNIEKLCHPEIENAEQHIAIKIDNDINISDFEASQERLGKIKPDYKTFTDKIDIAAIGSFSTAIQHQPDYTANAFSEYPQIQQILKQCCETAKEMEELEESESSVEVEKEKIDTRPEEEDLEESDYTFTDENKNEYKYINGIYVLQKGESRCEGLFQNQRGDIFCDSSVLINGDGFVVNKEGHTFSTDEGDLFFYCDGELYIVGKEDVETIMTLVDEDREHMRSKKKKENSKLAKNVHFEGDKLSYSSKEESMISSYDSEEDLASYDSEEELILSFCNEDEFVDKKIEKSSIYGWIEYFLGY